MAVDTWPMAVPHLAMFMHTKARWVISSSVRSIDAGLFKGLYLNAEKFQKVAQHAQVHRLLSSLEAGIAA